MDHYQVSASAFADAMGVGRSSISHILSGRNKPSLDFVMKIVDAYPDAQLRWLLYGEGNFPKAKEEKNIPTPPPKVMSETTTPTKEKPIETTNDLFNQSENRLVDAPPPIPEINENILSKETRSNGAMDSTIKKEIERIVFFYKDGSFKSYEN
ncbi:helix-turn-helix domain-containing protein [Aquimarina sp. W85]|uniref:helix-turn-helix domain-containing protein n=1 Tax=Aquimarina rhodophyticola TaxID=3342246 RepID=UPI003670E078